MYELFDNNGKRKALWKDNAVGIAVLKTLRHIIPAPYDEKGELKPGLLPYLAVQGIRIPVLTGQRVFQLHVANLTTTTGKAGIASRINGSGGEAAFTSIGFGTGTTVAAITDTALETGKTAAGAGDSGVHVLPTASVTVSRQTTDTTNDTARLVGTVAITATMAITESGVFNADTNGTMLCRQVFSAINVVNGDNLQLTWNIDVD